MPGMRRARREKRERGRPIAACSAARAAGLLTAIRPARAEDAAAIAAIYAPHVSAGLASFETTPPDTMAIAERMAAAGDRYPWLVTADDAGIMGYAYAGAFAAREGYRWTVETTVYVADRSQRRGVARALYAALVETLIAQRYVQAVAKIALPNPASVSLHEAMGFARVGAFPAIGWKHGRWLDVGLWQRALATPDEPPAEPTPWRTYDLLADHSG